MEGVRGDGVRGAVVLCYAERRFFDGMQLPEKDGKALCGRCLSLGEGEEGIKKKKKYH